jgi:hypothetical protein
MWWMAMALAAEQPRVTNPGLGLGFTSLAGPTTRGGALVELRSETAISRALQLNLSLDLGVTQPQNTLAMLELGVEIGAWTTRAVVDVTEWAARPTYPPLDMLKWMGAFFAYVGLGTCYAAVPAVWMVSPLGSVGHVVVGPTLSWHSQAFAPNLFVEAGAGGAIYGRPIEGGAGSGLGPILGLGSQVGKQSVAVRLWWSPPRLHTELGHVLVGSLVVGF